MKGVEMKKELSPKLREELFSALKARFEKNLARHRSLVWAKVQARLEAHPEKLWSLQEMERTGGEPDVVVLNPNGIPSFSPGLARNAGLRWVIRQPAGSLGGAAAPPYRDLILVGQSCRSAHFNSPRAPSKKLSHSSAIR